MRYRPIRRRRPIEAVEVGPLQRMAAVGAIEAPPWLIEKLSAGQVRIRQDVVEVMQPSGLVAAAGPNDLLVHVTGEVFPMRAEWFARLFAAVNDST